MFQCTDPGGAVAKFAGDFHLSHDFFEAAIFRRRAGSQCRARCCGVWDFARATISTRLENCGRAGQWPNKAAANNNPSSH